MAIINNEINNYVHIYNEIDNIIQNDINLLNLYNNKNIYNLNEESVNKLIEYLSLLVINNNTYYKYSNYWNLFIFIINIIKNYKNNTIDLVNSNFLLKLSILDKGQLLLEKIKNQISQHIILNKLTKEYIISIIIKEVCLKGTLPIFLFWEKIVNDDSLYNEYNLLLAYSCLNNDSRIFKFLINRIEKSTDIINIFIYLFDTRNSNKKIMKLLKILNNYIQLDKHFEIMIQYFNYGFKQFKLLYKYYYKNELSFNLLYNLLKLINEDDDINQVQKNYEYIYSILKFPNEKCYYIIIKNLFFTNVLNEEIDIINSKLFKKAIHDNNIIIITELSRISINIRYSNDLLKYILQEYHDNLYFNNYLKNHTLFDYYAIDSLWYYTKFLHFNFNKNIIKYNYILHKFRCKAKKIINKRKNEFKLKTSLIINEIKNFLPNKKYSVLVNGSLNYQINKQQFTTLPPRHILPFEVNYLENCLIKEKSDGININKLPNNIYPNSSIINYDVKGEYIEELDLYLIYDINLPNMDILERQQFLRNEHFYTKELDNLQNINNFNDLLYFIENERKNLIGFLKNLQTDIKWYPKASFKINNFNKNFISEINNYIEEIDKNTNMYINQNGIIKNDGFIITPLDGTQEIKIKPKSLLTIDLLFNNNNWLDSNSNKYNNIIINKTVQDNKIYRCYPNYKLNNLYFEPTEIRYDKKQPNSNKICRLLISLVKFNWLNNIDEFNIYYQKNQKINDNNICNILQENKKLFINYLKLLKPNHNKNWLDLGCGKCKFFNDIKIYNPKKYTAIDIDIKNTINIYKKYNEENIFEIYNCDLSSDWENSNYKIFDIDYNIKYDYIICNFSLMHFSTDLFWKQLDKIIKKDTIFIFNLTCKNINWNLNNSYLKSNNDECELYFEWLHNNPIKEKIISDLEIIKITEKYNWTIINKIKYNNNLLIKCYDWYTIIKK